jgi:hypothetical protein
VYNKNERSQKMASNCGRKNIYIFKNTFDTRVYLFIEVNLNVNEGNCDQMGNTNGIICAKDH